MGSIKLTNLSELKQLLPQSTIDAFSVKREAEKNTLIKARRLEVINNANKMLARLAEHQIDLCDVESLAVWQIQCLAEVANNLAKQHSMYSEQRNYYYEVKDALLKYAIEFYPENIHISESKSLLEISIYSIEAGVSCFHSPDSISQKFDRSKYSSKIHYFEWEWSGIKRQSIAMHIWLCPRLRKLISKATQPNKLLKTTSIKRINKLINCLA